MYHQRVIIESIFSAVKRKFGHIIHARKFNAQKNELMFRFIAYNREKLVNLSVIEFYFLLGQYKGKIYKHDIMYILIYIKHG